RASSRCLMLPPEYLPHLLRSAEVAGEIRRLVAECVDEAATLLEPPRDPRPQRFPGVEDGDLAAAMCPLSHPHLEKVQMREVEQLGKRAAGREQHVAIAEGSVEEANLD